MAHQYMDSIQLIDMQFWAYHGVLEAEKAIGQRFHIDCTLWLDLTRAGVSDALEYSVSYADVYSRIEEITTTKRFDLIEALTYHIIKSVIGMDARIQAVEVTVRKPQAPIPGTFSHACVTLKRERSDIEV